MTVTGWYGMEWNMISCNLKHGINHPEGCHTVCLLIRNGTVGTLTMFGMNVGMQLANEHGHELCALAIGRRRGDDVEVDAVVGG